MRSASPGDSGRSSRSPGASRPSTRASSASAGRAVAVPVSPDVPEKGEATGASTPARRAHERILRPPALPLISWHPAKGIRTGDASSSSPYEAPLNTLKHLSSILEACAARPETSKRRPAHTSPPSVHRPLHDLRNCADARALQYPSPSAASLWQLHAAAAAAGGLRRLPRDVRGLPARQAAPVARRLREDTVRREQRVPPLRQQCHEGEPPALCVCLWCGGLCACMSSHLTYENSHADSTGADS